MTTSQRARPGRSTCCALISGASGRRRGRCRPRRAGRVGQAAPASFRAPYGNLGGGGTTVGGSLRIETFVDRMLDELDHASAARLDRRRDPRWKRAATASGGSHTSMDHVAALRLPHPHWCRTECFDRGEETADAFVPWNGPSPLSTSAVRPVRLRRSGLRQGSPTSAWSLSTPPRSPSPGSPGCHARDTSRPVRRALRLLSRRGYGPRSPRGR